MILLGLLSLIEANLIKNWGVGLHLLKVMPAMTLLPARFLATLLPQAFRGTHKAIGGGRQATIVAVFGQLPLQFLDAFLQKVYGHRRLLQSFAQHLILLSQSVQFFIAAHTLTLANPCSSSQLWYPF